MSALDPESVSSPSGEQFGPYLVLERLGVGGMATVHRAREKGIEGFERTVALKRLLPHLAEDEDFVRSFVREAKLASLLSHGNIVQLFELGRVATTYFISMEYIKGRDIRQVLRQARRIAGPPPVHVVVALLTELCDALDYAHNRCDEDGTRLGLVHRDISPSNLLVSQDGHLKIIDFGIAKATAASLQTHTGRIKGKLSYMAPEAFLGRGVDGRSDLFSAAVIAHELLTARPLFAAKGDFQTIERVQKLEVAPPSQHNPKVPAELDAIVLKGLAKRPEQRWRSAAEMRGALEGLAGIYHMHTTNRDVAEWIDWGFALGEEPRSRRSSSGKLPLTPSSVEPVTASASLAELLPPSESLDELMDMVWGMGSSGEAVPIVLDEVPDVSARQPLALPLSPARLAQASREIVVPRPAPLALTLDGGHDDGDEDTTVDRGFDEAPLVAAIGTDPAARPEPAAATTPAPTPVGTPAAAPLATPAPTPVATPAPAPEVRRKPGDRRPSSISPIPHVTFRAPSQSPIGVAVQAAAEAAAGGPALATGGPALAERETAPLPRFEIAPGSLGARRRAPTTPSEWAVGTRPADERPSAEVLGVILQQATDDRRRAAEAAFGFERAAAAAAQAQLDAGSTDAIPGFAVVRSGTEQVTALPAPRSHEHAVPDLSSRLLRARWGIVSAVVASAVAVTSYVVLHDRGRNVAAAPTTAPIRFALDPPDAEIRIDHAAVAAPIVLEAGPHEIEISRAGYVSWVAPVDVVAGEGQYIRVALEQGGRREAHLRLESDPPGLTVLVDGTALTGLTPAELDVAPGRHSVAMRLGAQAIWSHEFDAAANTQYQFHPVLSAAGPAAPLAPARAHHHHASEVAPADDFTWKSSPSTPAAVEPAAVTPAPAPTPPPPASVLDGADLAPLPVPGARAQAALPPRATGPQIVRETDVVRRAGAVPVIDLRDVSQAPDRVSAKLCIDSRGHVTGVTLLSRVPDEAQSQLVRGLKNWRYEPYQAAGHRVPVCFSHVFQIRAR